MKRIAILVATLAFTSAFAEQDKRLLYGRTDPCNESAGQVWTCTIQCDPGVRSTTDSIFQRIQPNNAGVEICAVRSCRCEANRYYGSPRVTRPGFLAQDTSEELAVVVFGLDRMLGNIP